MLISPLCYTCYPLASCRNVYLYIYIYIMIWSQCKVVNCVYLVSVSLDACYQLKVVQKKNFSFTYIRRPSATRVIWFRPITIWWNSVIICNCMHWWIGWALSIQGGRVPNALACNARCHWFAPNSGDFSEIYFFESIQSPCTEGLKMVCVALQEFTVTCDVSHDNW